MSKFVDRKWRIASCVGFVFVVTSDLIGKYVAQASMTEIANRTAGLAIEPRGWLATRFYSGTGSLELVFAVAAAVCWGVSAYRSEPGSSLLLVLLAVLCLLLPLIIV